MELKSLPLSFSFSSILILSLSPLYTNVVKRIRTVTNIELIMRELKIKATAYMHKTTVCITMCELPNLFHFKILVQYNT